MANSSSAAPTPPVRAQNTDRRQPLGQRHRHRADGVAEQAEYVGPLAAEEIPDLAADQDERGRHQRLERDRGLNTADRGVKISHHRERRSTHSSTGYPRPARTSPSPAGAPAVGCHALAAYARSGIPITASLPTRPSALRCPWDTSEAGSGLHRDRAPLSWLWSQHGPTDSYLSSTARGAVVVLLMTRTVRGTAGVGVTADLVR